ncbi:MAG: KH domain-containing protein [Chloroflexota bacterium]
MGRHRDQDRNRGDGDNRNRRGGNRNRGGRGGNKNRGRAPNTRRQEALVRYLAERLVDDPAQVKISRRVEGSTVVLELSVASGDVGRVIGKNGRVAESMRRLIDVITHPRDRVILKIL